MPFSISGSTTSLQGRLPIKTFQQEKPSTREPSINLPAFLQGEIILKHTPHVSHDRPSKPFHAYREPQNEELKFFTPMIIDKTLEAKENCVPKNLDVKRLEDSFSKDVPSPGPRLPDIFFTEYIKELEKFILSKEKRDQLFLSLPTGMGKTVGGAVKIAECIKKIKASDPNRKIYGRLLMPFRISVKEIHQYVNLLVAAKKVPNISIGYAMRGEKKWEASDTCVIMTLGYFLEIISNIEKNDEEFIVMLDEFHDATWHTRLVYDLLIWNIERGVNIKLIVSSATLDPSGLRDVTLSHREENSTDRWPRKILEMKKENLKVNKIFEDKDKYFVERGKLTEDFYIAITEKVVKAYRDVIANPKEKGHILVMLPGEEEIAKVVLNLEKSHDLDDCLILSLYSKIDQELKNLAIRDSDKCKIICATPIVENAITINQLLCVVDCGYRKILSVNSEGVKELLMVMASKANITQCSGRTGRQDKIGCVHVMMSQSQYNDLNEHTINEVDRNPFYSQLMKLHSNQLPVHEIMQHYDQYKIVNNTNFLIDHCALLKIESPKIEDRKIEDSPGLLIPRKTPIKDHIDSDEMSDIDIDFKMEDREIEVSTEKYDFAKYKVTNYGKIMAALPISIRQGHFIAHYLIHGEDKSRKSNAYYYCAIVLAAFIEAQSSVFKHIIRKPRENEQDYKDRCQIANEEITQFYKEDCISTMFNVYFSSWCDPSPKDYYKWCKLNFISDRVLSEIQKTVDHILQTLAGDRLISQEKLPKIEQPSIAEMRLLRSNIDKICLALKPSLLEAYKEWKLIYKSTGKRSGDKPVYLDTKNRKYVIDRTVKTDISHFVVATSVRSIRGTLFASNLLNISPEDVIGVSSDLEDM